jgi:uncharacterized membrane protein
MELTNRETWAAAHGMIFGAVFLLAFAGGLAGLWSLTPAWVTRAGLQERMLRLRAGVVGMALVAWVTVVTGTYIVYPWYRAKTPDSPRSLLLADPNKADWHEFGMEWKEHVAWLSPMLATAVAFIVLYYGNQLIVDRRLRMVTMALFVLAFAAAAIPGVLGALITKAAPVQ